MLLAVVGRLGRHVRRSCRPRIFRGGTSRPYYKFEYAVAPDGQRFLFAQALEDEITTPITLVLNWKRPAS